MLTIKPTICYKNREVKAWNDIMFCWMVFFAPLGCAIGSTIFFRS